MVNDIFKNATKRASKFLNKNGSIILIGIGIVGGITTTVMVAKNAPKAKEAIEKVKDEVSNSGETVSKTDILVKEAKAIMPYYGPAIVMGGCSIACIIGSYTISAKRTAAYAAAYHITDKAFNEYKAKVVETIGEKKAEKVEEAIVKDHMEANPPVENDIIYTGFGTTLFYDDFTGRYFYSDINHIREAINKLNAEMIGGREMTKELNEYYDENNIPRAGCGYNVGWNVDNPIAIGNPDAMWSEVKGRPCGIIKFLSAPRYDYREVYR